MFQVQLDRHSGKAVAKSVDVVPTGTLAIEEVGAVEFEGLVSRAAREVRGGAGRRRQQVQGAGWLDFTDGEGAGQRLSFVGAAAGDGARGVELREGDRVRFRVVTDRLSGAVTAGRLQLIEAAPVLRIEGVVRAVKDGYGFIERADEVADIFFHFSEFPAAPAVGDNVRFEPMHKGSSMCAQAIEVLPPGTVRWDDVQEETLVGTVTKVPEDRNRRPGAVALEGGGESLSFSAGDVDPASIVPASAIKVGDAVTLRRAVDRREDRVHAAHVAVTDRPLVDGSASRERGLIGSIKDGYGFIKCADRSARVFYHWNEIFPPPTEAVQVGVGVEFAVAAGAKGRLQAVDIRLLPPDSVRFEVIAEERLRGVLLRLPRRGGAPGLIRHGERTVEFGTPGFADIRCTPGVGEAVEFRLRTCTRTKAVEATSVTRVDGGATFGFISALKEHFGFLVPFDLSESLHFRFSDLTDPPEGLSVGDPVTYLLGEHGASRVAIIPPDGRDAYYTVAPEAEERTGCIQHVSRLARNGPAGAIQCEDGAVPYDVALAAAVPPLRRGDPVVFRLARAAGSGAAIAVHIRKHETEGAAAPRRATKYSVEGTGRSVEVIRAPRGPDGTAGFAR